jgi:hypothetical protein
MEMVSQIACHSCFLPRYTRNMKTRNMEKQNIFADIVDSTHGDGFDGLAILCGFFIFLGVWIRFSSFWGALFVITLFGPFFGGTAAAFIVGLAMMFERRETDASRDNGHPIAFQLSRVLFALPLVLFSGAVWYVFWII